MRQGAWCLLPTHHTTTVLPVPRNLPVWAACGTVVPWSKHLTHLTWGLHGAESTSGVLRLGVQEVKQDASHRMILGKVYCDTYNFIAII